MKSLHRAAYVRAATAATSLTAIVLIVGAGRKF